MCPQSPSLPSLQPNVNNRKIANFTEKGWRNRKTHFQPVWMDILFCLLGASITSKQNMVQLEINVISITFWKDCIFLMKIALRFFFSCFLFLSFVRAYKISIISLVETYCSLGLMGNFTLLDFLCSGQIAFFHTLRSRGFLLLLVKEREAELLNSFASQMFILLTLTYLTQECRVKEIGTNIL